MRKTTLKGAAVAFAAAAMSLALGVTGAQADPSFTPDSDDLVGVGSDTTQILMNDVANTYNSATGATRRLASWDATGSATIVPRAGAAAITRPNGSSAGIAALAANSTLDWARSSSSPASYDAAYNGFTFYALATDYVSIALARANSDGSPTTNAPSGLLFTTTRLQDIYQCKTTADQWSDFVSGASTQKIVPMLPQAGSGTRKFFLESLALTETQVLTVAEGGCVVDTIQEHDAAPIDTNANAVAPFSDARYKANVPSVGGVKIIQLRNSTGNFHPSRTVYNVVRTSQTATFDPIFGNGGWACGTAGDTVVTNNGFTLLSNTACGVKTNI